MLGEMVIRGKGYTGGQEKVCVGYPKSDLQEIGTYLRAGSSI